VESRRAGPAAAGGVVQVGEASAARPREPLGRPPEAGIAVHPSPPPEGPISRRPHHLNTNHITPEECISFLNSLHMEAFRAKTKTETEVGHDQGRNIFKDIESKLFGVCFFSLYNLKPFQI
jgi:hypothetical protein